MDYNNIAQNIFNHLTLFNINYFEISKLRYSFAVYYFTSTLIQINKLNFIKRKIMKATKNFTAKQFILLGFILISTGLFATNNSLTVVTGRVVDSKKLAINYATATLINPETLKIVSGDMCDSNGNFIIENVKPGKYILSVRMVGFSRNELKNIEITTDKKIVNIESIAMNESIVSLNELEVIGSIKKNSTM